MSSMLSPEAAHYSDAGGIEEVGAVAGSRKAIGAPEGMGVVMSIAVEVEIVLGSVKMPLSKLMKLSRGAVIPLDRKVGEPVDVIVNNKVVARGAVVILDEDQSRFGVCLTSLAGLAGDEDK